MLHTDAGTPSHRDRWRHRAPSGRERTGVRRRCAEAPDRCDRRIAGWPADAPAQASTGGRIQPRPATRGDAPRRPGRRASRLRYTDGPARSATNSLCQPAPSAPRLKRETRHTVNALGTRPEAYTSETVDPREAVKQYRVEHYGGVHERNADQSRTDQG